MPDIETITIEAMEYINNDLSVEETASKLGVSKRTLQLHFKIIKEINPKLYELIQIKQKRKHQEGVVYGGQIGKVKPRYTKENATAIAETMINDELSYEEASEIFNIPKSTLYEMVHSDYIDRKIKDELDVLAIANKKRMLVNELVEESIRKGLH